MSFYTQIDVKVCTKKEKKRANARRVKCATLKCVTFEMHNNNSVRANHLALQ